MVTFPSLPPTRRELVHFKKFATVGGIEHMSLIRGGAAWDLYFYLGAGGVDTIFGGELLPLFEQGNHGKIKKF